MGPTLKTFASCHHLHSKASPENPLLPEDITPQWPSRRSLPIPHDLMQEATLCPFLGAFASVDKAPASEQGKPSSFPLHLVSQNLSPRLHPILLPSWGPSESLWIPTIPQVSSSLDFLISRDPCTTLDLPPLVPLTWHLASSFLS